MLSPARWRPKVGIRRTFRRISAQDGIGVIPLRSKGGNVRWSGQGYCGVFGARIGAMNKTVARRRGYPVATRHQ